MRTQSTSSSRQRWRLMLFPFLMTMGSSCATGTEPPDETPRAVDTSKGPDVGGDLERRLSQQLQTDPSVEQEFLYGEPLTGAFLCGVEVLGHDAPDTYYITVLCGDFPNDGGPMVSGGVSPAVMKVHGQGTAAFVTDVEFPRQSNVQEDVERLFPASLADEAVSGSPNTIPSLQELQKVAAQ